MIIVDEIVLSPLITFYTCPNVCTINYDSHLLWKNEKVSDYASLGRKTNII